LFVDFNMAMSLCNKNAVSTLLVWWYSRHSHQQNEAVVQRQRRRSWQAGAGRRGGSDEEEGSGNSDNSGGEFTPPFLQLKAAMVSHVARMHGIMGRLGLLPLLDPGFKVVGQ
jgi:hypothetical protein